MLKKPSKEQNTVKEAPKEHEEDFAIELEIQADINNKHEHHQDEEHLHHSDKHVHFHEEMKHIDSKTDEKEGEKVLHEHEKKGEKVHHEHEIQHHSIEIGEGHHHDSHAKSSLTPYILLIALSIHGLFEGTALGVQNHFKDAAFLCIAIIAHKWAESFSLGISFYKSGTERSTYIKMILLFAIFTPAGIVIGLLLSANLLMQAIFLGISSGTFVYVSASEVIVEEFAVTKYRYEKFFLYLCGGILVGLLAYLEKINI